MAKGLSKRLPGALTSDPKRQLLARWLDKPVGAARPAAELSLRRHGGAAPLSFAQQRLWFLQQWQPGNPAYNIARAYRISGVLDREILARSLEVIARRHEILRTSFPDSDEQPVQLVSQTAAPTLRMIDRRHLPAKGRDAAVAQEVSQEAGHCFDLTTGPLLRLSLYQFAKDDHVLVLVAHQSIFDGRSLDIFYRELEILYAAGGAVERANLPILTVQYADYACWQRDRQSDAALAESTGLLEDAPRRRLAGIGTTDRSAARRATERQRISA